MSNHPPTYPPTRATRATKREGKLAPTTILFTKPLLIASDQQKLAPVLTGPATLRRYPREDSTLETRSAAEFLPFQGLRPEMPEKLPRSLPITAQAPLGNARQPCTELNVRVS